jgi:hypothetical protein
VDEDEYEYLVFDLTLCICTHEMDQHGDEHCDVENCHCDAHWVD